MRSTRKGMALLLTALMALVAACGGAPQQSTQAPATSAPAPAPEVKKDPVKISFWHGMADDSAHGKVLKEIVNKYNASQKDVIVEATYQGSYGDLEKKLTAAIAAGTPPTVVQATDSMLSNLVRAKAVQSLDSLLPANEKADYAEALVGDKVTYDGKLMALPFNASVVVNIYDKKRVPNPPKTWDEFAKVSKELSGGGNYGTAFSADVYYFGNHLFQAGGQFVNADKTKAAFNSEAGVQALQYMADLVKNGAAIQLKPREYQSDYFNAGRAAMVLTTSASFAYIKPASGNPWGVAMIPAGPKNDLTGLSGANVAVVNGVKPEETQAAMKWLLYLTGKEGTLMWAIGKTGYMPVRKSAVADPRWAEFVKANPEYEVLGVAVSKGTVHPNHPQWRNAQGEITSAVEAVILGQKTAKQALDEAAKKVDDLLAKK